jgi:Holliday junction resolvase RusA-like endonuclease
MKQDPDNAICSVNDVLQDAGIIENDGKLLKGNWQIIRKSEDWSTKVKILAYI